jgi:hypothetical protein
VWNQELGAGRPGRGSPVQFEIANRALTSQRWAGTSELGSSLRELRDASCYKMRVRGQMVVERIAEINKTIENISAKVELAAHNVLVLRLTIDNQETRRDEIGEQQEEEEAAIRELKENIEEMIRERESRMSTGTNWLKRLWRSAVLNAFPAQRNCVQRNLQMRAILERERPTFPELDLPTSAYLPTSEENREQEQKEEQERVQRKMNEELEDREDRERELLASWVEEDTKLECLRQLLAQHFHPQWVGLVEQRNREILRTNEIAGDF